MEAPDSAEQGPSEYGHWGHSGFHGTGKTCKRAVSQTDSGELLTLHDTSPQRTYAHGQRLAKCRKDAPATIVSSASNWHATQMSAHTVHHQPVGLGAITTLGIISTARTKILARLQQLNSEKNHKQQTVTLQTIWHQFGPPPTLSTYTPE